MFFSAIIFNLGALPLLLPVFWTWGLENQHRGRRVHGHPIYVQRVEFCLCHVPMARFGLVSHSRSSDRKIDVRLGVSFRFCSRLDEPSSSRTDGSVVANAQNLGLWEIRYFNHHAAYQRELFSFSAGRHEYGVLTSIRRFCSRAIHRFEPVRNYVRDFA